MRDKPSWLNFTFRHIEHDPKYTIDAYTIEVQVEVRDEGDEEGNTSDYQYYFVACSAHRVSYHGEDWGWNENSPLTVTWRNLRRELKRSVLLDCLDHLEYLKPVQIWFDHEDSPGNPREINPKDYGIDINQYLYKEAQHG